jgi:entericidin A
LRAASIGGVKRRDRTRAIALGSRLWKSCGTRKKGLPMKASLVLTALAGAALLLAGCATVKGMGRDIESVGQAGEDAMKGK